MFTSLGERATRLLRFSERYTKTDMLYVARGSVFSLLGQGAVLIATLTLAVVVSHFLSKESYGIYKYILSVVSLLSLFSLNGIWRAVFQSAAQGYDGVLRKAFWENIRWSIGVFVGTLGIAGYYFWMGDSTFALGILIGGGFSPFLASASLFGSFLGGKKDFYRLMVYSILDNVVPIGIFIGAVLLTQNPAILIAVYCSTNTLAALYFYRRTLKVYQSTLHKDDAGLLVYSKHLSLMGIINGIASQIDQVLIFQFVGPAELAIYNFAIAIPEQIKNPIKNLRNMLLAQFINRSAYEIRAGMTNKVLWLLAGSATATALYIAVAPLLFSYLFPNYLEAVWYSQIYALWMLTIALDPVSTYLVARKLTKELYINSVFSAVFQIVSVVVGVIFWGLLGVVGARVVTRVCISTVDYLLYRRAIGRELAADFAASEIKETARSGDR